MLSSCQSLSKGTCEILGKTMASPSKKDRAKKKDIAELIRLMTAQRELLEPNITMFVQQTILTANQRGIDEVASLVTERIQNESERLLIPFDEVFTHDEIMLLISFYKQIKMLIGFYKSEAMKKFLRNGRKLFDPIYDTYREVIEDLLKHPKSY